MKTSVLSNECFYPFHNRENETEIVNFYHNNCKEKIMKIMLIEFMLPRMTDMKY